MHGGTPRARCAPALFVTQRFSLAFWWRCLVKNRLQSLLKAEGSGAFDGRISVPLRMSKNWKTNNKTHSFGRHMLIFLKCKTTTGPHVPRCSSVFSEVHLRRSGSPCFSGHSVFHRCFLQGLNHIRYTVRPLLTNIICSRSFFVA